MGFNELMQPQIFNLRGNNLFSHFNSTNFQCLKFLDNKIIEKPKDEHNAFLMLKRLVL